MTLWVSPFSKLIRQYFAIAAVLFSALLFALPLSAQKQADSTIIPSTVASVDSMKLYDSIRRKEAKKATIRSAVLPGWGQITNKQAWKLPAVYAAVGIPAYLFFYNLDQYKMLRDAYIIVSDDDPTNDDDIPEELQPLSPNSIRYYRDQYRRNVDYSALAFIIAWGLNVVDAAVFANLRDFDVGDNLSMRISPQINPLLKSGGVHLAIRPSNNREKKIIQTR